MSIKPLTTVVTLLLGAALGAAIAPAVATEAWEKLDTKGWIFIDANDPALGTVTPLKGRDRLVIIPKGSEKMIGVTMDNGPACSVTIPNGVGLTLLTVARTGETYGLTIGAGEGRLTAAWQGPDALPIQQLQ